jgi:outer membrane protein insertion porin family
VTVTGHTVFSQDDLIKISGLRAESTFTLNRLNDGLDSIREAYAQKSFFQADVTPQSVAYDSDGQAEVELTITEGAQTRIAFEGHEFLSENELKRLIRVTSVSDVSETALQAHVETLLEIYREEGFHFVDVAAENIEEQGHPTVRFTVKEGPRVKVQDVVIQGNAAMTAKELRAVMLTGTSGLFTTEWYQDKVFEEDILAIGALYEQQGYLSANIVSVLKEFSQDRTGVTLSITIEEGIQTLISDVRITGELDEERLTRVQRLNLLEAGMPLTRRDVTTTIGQIQNYYNNQGYLNAVIDLQTAFNDDDSQARVTLQISAGQQFFVAWTCHSFPDKLKRC